MGEQGGNLASGSAYLRAVMASTMPATLERLQREADQRHHGVLGTLSLLLHQFPDYKPGRILSPLRATLGVVQREDI